MSNLSPYLQRRGSNLNFRIAIPADLRAFLGGREITKTLRTADKQAAVPAALEHAARIKRAYADLRAAMATPDPDKLKEVLRAAKVKIMLADRDDRHGCVERRLSRSRCR